MQVSAHFSKIKEEIIANLSKANSEIKVAVAWLTDEDIIRKLSQKAESGVDVQIIISDSKENFKTTRKFKDYLKAGGKLYVSTPKFLHNKFCIIDRKTIINGSYNWTYFARNSEENILVISLENSLQEDNKLVFAFEAKFKFLYERISLPIVKASDLSRFQDYNKDNSLLLAQIDEAEILLRKELETDVEKSFKETQALGIQVGATLLDRMKTDGGGVEFIKRILHDEMSSKEMKSGFKQLENAIPHRVDLSLEYLASRPKYQTLFSESEVAFCKNLMSKYNL